ncbi:MAG: hypothetical protein Q7T97_18600 [Burkholderiaceae bacterium]|nr:hypothetical protein [Burkholderiaceae bacterium]
MNQQLNRNDPLDASDLAGRFIRLRHSLGGLDRWRTAQPGQRRYGLRTDHSIGRSCADARRDDRDDSCCTPEDEHAGISV